MELKIGRVMFREAIFSYKEKPFGKPIAYTRKPFDPVAECRNGSSSNRGGEYLLGRALCILAIPFYASTSIGEYFWTVIRTAYLGSKLLAYKALLKDASEVGKKFYASCLDVKNAPFNYFKVFFQLLAGALLNSMWAVQYNDSVKNSFKSL